MSWTAYFKTEKTSSLLGDGYSFITTSINNPILFLDRITNWFSLILRQIYAKSDKVYYLHDDAPTEPVTDGLISSTVYGGPEVTYSVAGDPPGYIYSFTSENGIFTSNQDFSKHNTVWKIKYNATYSGTPPAGYNPFIKFEFYKRDSSNVDTLLFTVTNGLWTLSPIDGQEINVVPSGSVLTSDRLRIRVYAGAAPPT